MPFDGARRVTPISDAMRAYFQGGKMWRKGSVSRSGHPRCLIGGLIEAKGRCATTISSDENRMLLFAIKLAGFGEWSGAYWWNDTPERTYADVERVLDALAEIEAEQNVT